MARTSAKNVLKKEVVVKDDLFSDTSKECKQDDKQSNNQNDIEVSKQVELKRQTYYLEDDIIQALGLKAVMERRDKSEIVRAALRAYIEEKYMEVRI